MKLKLMMVVICLLLLFSLAACGGSKSADSGTTQTGGTGNEAAAVTDAQNTQPPKFTGDVPLSTQLLLGTFKLEGTDLAVSKSQASELLPLWKAVKSLSNSATASTVEVGALYNQIQDTMTDEQLNQIASMEFDGESMRTLMNEMGLGMNMGNRQADGETDGGARMPPDGMGDPGMGGPGMGGPGFGGQGVGENLSDEERATAMAEMNGGEDRMALILVDPLIALLEERSSQ